MSQAEPSSPAFRVSAAGDSHIGRRKYNEDAILLRPDLNLYLLADGAGGHNAGNVASALAVTTVAHYFEGTEESSGRQPPFDALGLSRGARRLAAAIHQANAEVVEVAKTSDRHHGMGTTIVATHFVPEEGVVHIAHVGDSRCYRLRDGRLELLTYDHTLVNDVLELRPDLPEEETAKLPRHVITRALGMSEGVRIAVRTHEVVAGDRYLLCSDGLTDSLDEEQILNGAQAGKEPDEQVRALHDMVMPHADDNVATISIVCSTVPGAPKKHTRPVLRVRSKHQRSAAAMRPSAPPLSDDDYPEIIVVEDDVHVVPARSGTDAQRSAVRDLLNRRQTGDDR